VAALTRGLWLLRSAVTYTLGAAGLASRGLLARPTPCEGWDLRLLLRHVADSMDVLSEAMTAGSVRPGPQPGDTPFDDPVMMLRDRACGLLALCAVAGPDERPVVVGDRELSVSWTAVTGALEVTVHGWDIAVACGSRQPIPPVLAAVLLPVAPLLVRPATRPGLFSDPVPVAVPGRSGPGDQLVAFLGRQPRPPHLWTRRADHEHS
jgi:uncharacterized protein (TIGR03086 family)